MHSFVLLIWLALCAAQDVRDRHIGNGLTLGVGAVALIYLLVTGSTWLGADGMQGALAVVLALAFTLPGYALRRLGGGDVKLMTALAIATDGQYLLGAFIGAALASVVWVLVAPKLWLHASQRLRRRLQNFHPQVSKKLPFAPFVLIGAILTVLWLQ